MTSKGKGIPPAPQPMHTATQSFQRRLFPIEIVHEYPNNQGSADLGLIVNARDGRDYAVKRTTDGRGKIPASEYLCYELAYRVLIPTPNYEFIKLSNGDLGFGSLWEGGVKKLSHDQELLDILRGRIPINGLPRFLSRVYAFDLFVNNEDRHWGNYIWRTSFDGSLVALAFDFSRACFETGHASHEAFDPNCNTQHAFRWICLTQNYIRQEAIDCLDDIAKIDSSDISEILDGMPTKWLSKADRHDYIAWWDSQERHDRVAYIKGRI